MWYDQQLSKYQNDTRAALCLFLPLPDGMSAREFDQAARSRRLSGVGRAWENTLLESCRLLASSVPTGSLPDTLRHARHLASEADGKNTDALGRLDPTLPAGKDHAIREDRARRALRRAFNLPGYGEIRRGWKGSGAAPQRQRHTESRSRPDPNRPIV